MGKITDITANDIHDLIMYLMWSRDKIAGGVKREQAVQALSRLIDYDLQLMMSIALKHEESEDE